MSNDGYDSASWIPKWEMSGRENTRRMELQNDCTEVVSFAVLKTCDLIQLDRKNSLAKLTHRHENARIYTY